MGRPETDALVTEFFRWLTHTHTMWWHAHYHIEGTGDLYQGQFKTFPIEEDEHLLSVLRYVERNEAEEKAVRKCLKKGQPYGSDAFLSESAVRLQLEHTQRSRSRPMQK